MWEVTFLQWLKSKGRLLPILALLILLFWWLFTIFKNSNNPPQKVTEFRQQKKQPLDQGKIPEAQTKRFINDETLPTDPTIPERLHEKNDLNEFTKTLAGKLSENSMDPHLAFRIAERIDQSFRYGGAMETYQVLEVIAEELGPSAPKEEIDEIYRLVIQSVSHMSELPGPKPSFIP